MNFREKLQLAYQKIRASNKILLVSHLSPDADALASIGAMIEVLKKENKSWFAFAKGKPTGVYKFINNEQLISATAPESLLDFDLIIILDCGSIARTGLEPEIRELLTLRAARIKKKPYLIEFDHHQQQESYADLEIREPKKAATTEIIYHFLLANQLEITKPLANCILIGLMTDTGHFLHANASREALAIASEMLLFGASLPKIINKTVHNKSFSSLKLWGKVLERMKYNDQTGLLIVGLSQADLRQIFSPQEQSAKADLFGDIISFLSYLSGVQVALMLREEEGWVRGNLRTTSDQIDVAKIAAWWGGGGHQKAAGFALKGKLKEVAGGWTVLRQED